MSFEEWKEYRLGDICTKIGSGATPKGGKESYLDQGEFSLIRSQNILDFSFSYDGLAYINGEQASKLSNVCVEKEDVLLNITGDSVARVCQVPNEVLPARVNQHVAIIRPQKETLDNAFLKYYLLNPSFKNFMLGLSSVGGTRNALTKGMIEDFKLTIPELTQQKRIASILSSLDDKIELNRQTNQTLEAIAQAIFKEWFVDFNFPGATGEMEDSELGKIPKGWRVGKVGEICTLNTNTISKRDSFEWIDYIEISEVSRGTIGEMKRYKFDQAPSRAKRKLRHGDVVISTVRPNRGSYFLAFEPNYTTIVSTGFCVFTALIIPFSFLYLFLTDEKQLQYYGHVADGGAYPAINPSLIMAMDILIPPEQILDVFHKNVEPLLSLINLNRQQSQILTQLRDSLLPKLMKGEIAV